MIFKRTCIIIIIVTVNYKYMAVFVKIIYICHCYGFDLYSLAMHAWMHGPCSMVIFQAKCTMSYVDTSRMIIMLHKYIPCVLFIYTRTCSLEKHYMCMCGSVYHVTAWLVDHIGQLQFELQFITIRLHSESIMQSENTSSCVVTSSMMFTIPVRYAYLVYSLYYCSPV